MALTIEFEGFVNEVKTFSWGTVVKMSHAQRAKNDATGLWETVGKDYLDVTWPAEAVLPGESAIVRVKGTLKSPTTFEKRDGSHGVSLKVRAQEVSAVERRGNDFTADAGNAFASVGATPVEDETW